VYLLGLGRRLGLSCGLSRLRRLDGLRLRLHLLLGCSLMRGGSVAELLLLLLLLHRLRYVETTWRHHP
jgi:hypothetical protein